MTLKYVLRDLPGVAELEAMLERIQAHPSPHWAPENDLVEAAARRIARDSFGLTDESYEFDWRRADGGKLAPGAPMWERSIWHDVGDERGEAEARAWEEDQWDVRNATGQVMLSMAFFDMIIVGVSTGTVGRLPDQQPGDREISSRAEDWEAVMAAEAAKFKGSRR